MVPGKSRGRASFEESITIRTNKSQSTQSHDRDARATKVISEARKLPLGQFGGLFDFVALKECARL
jgi:hypothetical protein